MIDTKNVDIIIGNSIRDIRKMKSLTQEQLAELMNLSRPSIINTEMGRQHTNSKTIFKLCAIFGITPNDLFPAIPKYELTFSTIKRTKTVVKEYSKPILKIKS